MQYLAVGQLAMTPTTAAVTGRAQTGATGSAKCFVVPPGCQWRTS